MLCPMINGGSNLLCKKALFSFWFFKELKFFAALRKYTHTALLLNMLPPQFQGIASVHSIMVKIYQSLKQNMQAF